MPNFITPFTTPENYTYDISKIEVINGLAKLKENLSNVYARWHLNQTSGANVPDSSGNNRDGATINDPSWVSGKLNNAIQLNGTNQYINCGNIAGFDSDNNFSLECWAQWDSLASMALISKMQSGGLQRGYLSFVFEGSVYFLLRTSAASYMMLSTNNDTFNNNAFHHVIITYDGSSLASGVNIYVDSINQTLNVVSDNLNNSITNSIDCEIGSRDGVDYFEGIIDEVLIYDAVLIQEEVDYKYNAGSGHEDEKHYTDKPTIFKTAGDTDSPILNFTNFVVSKGEYEGSLTYQLSDNGINWLYWNGSIWASAGVDDYNSEATANINILTFTTFNEKIYVKSFLISDGTQHVEVDEIQIGYTTNIAPNVYAGANKNAKDEQTIAPFADSSFDDPDGAIDHAYYKVDNEIPIFIEIQQGGYGTLLEAVQAFTYKFSNVGEITVRLQVEDNEGAKNEDSLTVTVTKHTITFTIKDAPTNNHLSSIVFSSGDGSDNIIVDSPFDYDYEVGAFYVEFNKAAYSGISDTLLVTVDAIQNYSLGLTLTQPDIPVIIDNFFDEQISDHAISGSFGEIIQTMQAQLIELLGLNGSNLKLFNSVYTNGNLTQQDGTTHKTKEDLEEDVDAIATYQSQATYIDGKFHEGTFKKL